MIEASKPSETRTGEAKFSGRHFKVNILCFVESCPRVLLVRHITLQYGIQGTPHFSYLKILHVGL